MTNEEIIEKVVKDMLVKGQGMFYFDHYKMYKRDPWYRRLWNWLSKRGAR